MVDVGFEKTKKYIPKRINGIYLKTPYNL